VRVVKDDANVAALRGALAWSTGGIEILYLGAVDDVAVPSSSESLIARLARIATIVDALARLRDVGVVRLWLVTRGAQAPDGELDQRHALQAGVWGFGRVVALEHPEVWGGLVDLDPAAGAEEAAATLFAALAAAGNEDQLVVRRGRIVAPRLERSSIESPAPVGLRADGAYLVTGGTGGVAAPLIPWLVARGAGHIVLASRRGLPAPPAGESLADDGRRAIDEAIRAAEAGGAKVEVVACDVTEASAVAALVSTFGVSRPRLRGVIHAAVSMTAAPVRELDQAAIGAMLRPKLDGAINLEAATSGLELDFTLYFSSTTALLGVAGLAHYAAANEALDALAWSGSNGRRKVAINWGTWEQMRLASEGDRRTFLQAGLSPMASADALDRLGRVLATPSVRQKVVAAVDWSVLKPVYEAKRVRPFLADVGPLASVDAAAARKGPAGEASVLAGLRTAPRSERQDRLIAYLRQQVANVLALPSPEAVSITQGLFEMGMDSLMSVELRNALERGLDHPLPSTLTFNYPNVAALAAFITAEILERAEGHDAAVAPAPQPAAASSVPAAATAEAGDRDDMSEDELAELLASRLSKLR
jgi:myxalamid-type polyketide synthase MxaE and MxaD